MMEIIVSVQLMAAVFALLNAFHDAPAVDSFRTFGSNGPDQQLFHNANLLMRGAVLILCASNVFLVSNWLTALLTFISCMCIMWLVFDIVLNLKRDGNFKWYYLRNKGIDGRLLQWFGKKAGKLKAITCAVIVSLTNYFIITL